MQAIIIEKPYKFIPPHRGTGWPWFIHKFKLTDWHLRKSEGINKYQIRGLEHLSDSVRRGHGILLTPNHCRYSDPLVLGWLARAAKVHVYAMASWHLFHQSGFQAFAIRKMGGFSIYREGLDRQSLDTAIQILADAERPLMLFPEGAVFRANDRLQPFLDGVAFVARSAAKRQAKEGTGRTTVIHPVAIKYLYHGDIITSVTPVLKDLERRFTLEHATLEHATLEHATLEHATLEHATLEHSREMNLIARIDRLTNAFLSLKEIEYYGSPQSGSVEHRQGDLIEYLIAKGETKWLGRIQPGHVVGRIKNVRAKIVPELTQGKISAKEREERWGDLRDLYLAQQIASYPADYLGEPTTVTRILETVEKLEEDITGKARPHLGLEAVIEVAPAIEVATGKPSRENGDPLTTQLHEKIAEMLSKLSQEARQFSTSTSSEKLF